LPAVPTPAEVTGHDTTAPAAAEEARGSPGCLELPERDCHTVEDLHDATKSAFGVVHDAELESAKARLSDRGSFSLQAAAEPMAEAAERPQHHQ
jgi:hypothetical protein